MHPTITRLTDALARRTEDALGKLDALDQEAALAFEQAERAAGHVIAARLARLENDAADRTRKFETRVADLMSAALDAALESLERSIDTLAGVPADGKGDRWVPTPEALAEEAALAARDADDLAPAAALPTADDAPPWDGDPYEDEDLNAGKEIEEAHDAGRRSAAVAAQLVAAEPPAYEAADPDDDRPDGDGEPAALFERQGRGRRSSYARVESPEPGRTYYRRVNNRWREVVYRPAD